MTDDRIVIELNPSERRLWDRLRANLVPPRAGGSSQWRDLLLLLPDLSVLLARLLRDERVPVGAKLVALLGLGYVLLPIDLVPEVLLGPIGLFDDLFVVAAALSRIVNEVHPDVVRSHWSGKGDALEAIQRLTQWADSQVTGRLRGFVRSLLERLGLA
jgi:uncharacterized membrane protein YkvA (DUF1232 family)